MRFHGEKINFLRGSPIILRQSLSVGTSERCFKGITVNCNSLIQLTGEYFVLTLARFDFIDILLLNVLLPILCDFCE